MVNEQLVFVFLLPQVILAKLSLGFPSLLTAGLVPSAVLIVAKKGNS